MRSTQMLLSLLFFSPLMLGFSCKKDNTVDLDITKFHWELESIKHEGKTYKVPDDEYRKPDTYVLRFKSDSTFQLDFRTNAGRGRYEIYS